MPAAISGTTSAPVDGSDVVVAAGGCVRLSLSTLALGTFTPGTFVCFSPRTLEQKWFAAVGTHALPPPPPPSVQPGAVGLVVQSLPPPSVQPGAVGLVVQSLPPPSVQPGAVGLVVQSLPPPPPVVGVVHPVCAGLLRPMPWLRSHS